MDMVSQANHVHPPPATPGNKPSGMQKGQTGQAGPSGHAEATDAKKEPAVFVSEKIFARDNLRLRIEFDEKTDRFIYLGVDPESGEVVRQYPPEDVLKQSSLLDGADGIAIDETV